MGALAGDYSFDTSKKEFFEFTYSLGNVKARSDVIVNTDTSEKYILEESNDQKVFLKRIPDYAADPLLMAERYGFVKFLISNGFKTPHILNSHTGQSWVEYNDAFWMLYSYVSGEGFKNEDRYIANTASLLADLHELSANYLTTQGEVSSASTTILFIDLVIENIPEIGDMPILLEQVLKLKKMCQSYKEKNFFKDLKCIWVHGDFSPNNILYKGCQAAWLVDFDNAHINTKIHDLAELYLTSTVFEYADTSTNFAGDVPFREAFIQNEILFNSYQSKIFLSKDEKLLFGDILMLVYLELVFLGVLRGDYTLSEYKLDQIIETCYYIKDFAQHLLKG